MVFELNLQTVQFHELNSAQKGYGEQMVSSVLNVLPDDLNHAHRMALSREVLRSGVVVKQ